jgi:hypothetical protein
MVIETPESVIVMDLDAQTMTTINRTMKTYTVQAFAEMANRTRAAGTSMNIDVRKTGERKTIGGFNAEEVVLSMAGSAAAAGRQGAAMQMQIEMHIWISADVPGYAELRAFHEKYADRMPWAALAQGNPSMADAQRKLASMHGVPVLETIKAQAPGGGQAPQMNDQMAKLRAQMEEMKKQGGQQAAMADQIMARMGAASAQGSGFDSTIESSGFSTGPVPDSVFGIPAGFRKAER